ncbi:cingulin-like [Struthio camelus]|uniref:cingulin-like n=1 Tax=Struthio camelus TaxID=8801 RepID=UPI003603DC90
MSCRRRSSFAALPSRYSGDGCYQLRVALGPPSWARLDAGRQRRDLWASRHPSVSTLHRSNRKPLSWDPFQAETLLNASAPFLSPRSGGTGRSTSPIRGIPSAGTGSSDHAEDHVSLSVGRRHSLSHLPEWGTEGDGVPQPLDQRVQGGFVLDLRAELATSLREPSQVLGRQKEELVEGDQEVDLSRVKSELLSLKLKMQNMQAHLEREKKWLELSRREDQEQKGDMHDRILGLELEVARANTDLRGMSCCLGLSDPSRMAAGGWRLARHQRGADGWRVTGLLQANEALHEPIGRVQEAARSIDLEKEQRHQRAEELSQWLAPALGSQGGFGDWTLDLQPELPAGRELLALEQREMRVLRLHGSDLEEALQGHGEDLQCRPGEQRQQTEVPARSSDVTSPGLQQGHPVASLARAGSSVASPAQERLSPLQSVQCSPQGSGPPREPSEEAPADFVPPGRLSEVERLRRELQREITARQEKEELVQTLRAELEELKQKKAGEIQASLGQADAELALVREELQKVWHMLKTRDTELEQQHLKLEQARHQHAECSSEKQRLEQLVTTLEQQLAEKDQALRQLRQEKEREKTELEIKASSLDAVTPPNTEVPRDAAPQVPAAPSPAETPSSDLSRGRCSLAQGGADRGAEQQDEEVFSSPGGWRDGTKALRQRRDGRAAGSPAAALRSLKQQQQRVTEQLKGLFRQRQQLPTDLWTLLGEQRARTSRGISSPAFEMQELQQRSEESLRPALCPRR